MARIISYEKGVETLRKETMKVKDLSVYEGQVIYILSYDELMEITVNMAGCATRSTPKILAGWSDRMLPFLGKEYVVTGENRYSTNALRFDGTKFSRDMLILKRERV